jgi:DNA invertase Pin-like site-specific DNA recombinase
MRWLTCKATDHVSAIGTGGMRCYTDASFRPTFSGVFAEFERPMIRERVLAGLARAKEQGVGLGRRRLEDSDSAKVAAIKRALTGKQGCGGSLGT